MDTCQRTGTFYLFSYFHVVFTLPVQLNAVARHHPKELYSILFKTAWQTLSQFGDNPEHLGAKMGMIGVLHTWGQNLSLHPCLRQAGAFTLYCPRWWDNKSRILEKH